MPTSTPKKKILIGEDERPMAQAMMLKLTRAGFAITVAANGEEVMTCIADNGIFDLLLLDIMMPKKDGFSVLRELKEKNIEQKTIVLSNLSQAEDEQKARELGAIGFFIKSNTPIAKIVENVQAVI